MDYILDLALVSGMKVRIANSGELWKDAIWHAVDGMTDVLSLSLLPAIIGHAFQISAKLTFWDGNDWDYYPHRVAPGQVYLGLFCDRELSWVAERNCKIIADDLQRRTTESSRTDIRGIHGTIP